MKRPRFSLRTLAIVVTLAGAYFGAWEATKKYAVPVAIEGDSTLVPKKYSLGKDTGSPMPFFVRRIEWRSHKKVVAINAVTMNSEPTSTYHLWMFGPTVRLPFESRLLP